MGPSTLVLLALLIPETGECSTLVDVSDGWRVNREARGEGEKQGWAGRDFDDSSWPVANLATNLDPADEKTIWVRKWLDRPLDWPKIYLVLSGLKGRAAVFINGVRLESDLERPHQGTLQVVREISTRAGSAGRMLIAIRISTEPGRGPPGFECAGGTPVMLARDIRGLFIDRLGWFDYLAQEYRDFPWPSWAMAEGMGWFPIVSSSGERGPLMGTAGQLEPEDGDFAVSVWLYYPAGRRFYSLESATGVFTLEGRYLPLPLFKAKVGRWFQVYVRGWLHSSEESASPRFGVGQVTVENTLDRTREIDLIIAIHPFGCRFPPHEIERISFDSKTRTVSVNGRPAMILSGEPDSFGGTSFSESGGTVARLLTKQLMPEAYIVDDPTERLASAAAVYHLRIQPFGSRTQTFRFLLEDGEREADSDLLERIRNINWKKSWEHALGAWRTIMSGPGKTVIRLPDSAAQNAFYASVAYVRMALAKGGVPEKEKLLAFAALIRAGHEDALKERGIDPSKAWEVEEGIGFATPGLGHGQSPRVAPGYEALGFYWPGAAMAAARRLLEEGENDEAGAILDWWLARQTFPGTFIWAEAVDPVTGRYGGGSIPDVRAAAGCVCLLRDMMLREKDGALMLASGVPVDWTKPGRRLQIRHAPTKFGTVPGVSVVSSPREISMRMYTFEQLARLERRPTPGNLIIARPPSGYRWRIPGDRPITKLLIDGKTAREIPENRILDLERDFRSVRVIW